MGNIQNQAGGEDAENQNGQETKKFFSRSQDRNKPARRLPANAPLPPDEPDREDLDEQLGEK